MIYYIIGYVVIMFILAASIARSNFTMDPFLWNNPDKTADDRRSQFWHIFILWFILVIFYLGMGILFCTLGLLVWFAESIAPRIEHAFNRLIGADK